MYKGGSSSWDVNLNQGTLDSLRYDVNVYQGERGFGMLGILGVKTSLETAVYRTFSRGGERMERDQRAKGFSRSIRWFGWQHHYLLRKSVFSCQMDRTSKTGAESSVRMRVGWSLGTQCFDVR